MSLAEAVEALRQGAVRGVQVRYTWNGDSWFDTLLRVSDGVKLVRMKSELRA